MKWISLRVGLVLSASVLPSSVFAQGGQPSLVSVAFTSPTVPGGTNATAVVTIDRPAPTNGFEVSLAITSNVAQLSASAVTIASGQTSAQILVSTTATATLQLATLTASARSQSRTGNLTVAPPTVRSLTMSPTTLTAGQSATGSVTLDGPAPTAGMTVTLSDNSSLVTTPATIQIVAGQTTASFTATTATSLTTQTAVEVSALAGSVARSATLTLLPPPLSVASVRFTERPASGIRNTVVASLSRPAPAGGALVHFSAPGAGIASVDTVPEGGMTASLSFTPPITGTDRPFTLTVSVAGASFTHNDVLRGPRITAVVLDPDTATSASTRVVGTFRLDAMPSGLPVVFTNDNPAVVTDARVASVSYPLSNFVLTVSPVTRPTSVLLTFQLNGSTSSKTLVVLPPPPTLTGFTITPSTVRAGQVVTMTVGLSTAAPAGGVRVPTAIAGPVDGGLNIPQSIIVAGGATTGSARFTATSTVPLSLTVTVAAQLNGTTKSTSLTISP